MKSTTAKGTTVSRFGPADFVNFWSALGSSKVHPDDRLFMRAGDFATDLYPQPWVGPVRNARVYVLLLNPGLSPHDRAHERRVAFSEAVRFNLSGRGPYLYLLERFKDHPGGRWARKVFGKDIVEAHCDQMCVVQLVPYHSKEGQVARSIAPTLPSSAAAIRFLHSWLLPEARARRIGLIVARASGLWGVADEVEGRHVVIYRGAECRGAFQTPKTRGGQLLRRLVSG